MKKALFLAVAALAAGCATQSAPKRAKAFAAAPKAVAAASEAGDAVYGKFDLKRGFMRMVVPASWPEQLRQQQIALAQGNGYLPVTETGSSEETDFVKPVMKISRYQDAYAVTWIQSPKVVRLDRTKLVAAFQGSGQIDAVSALVMSSPEFSDWYANKMTYVRGSADAVAIAQMLGLDQAGLEALVLQCRED